MGISTELQYVKLDELYLDPKNPRLGRYHTSDDLSQAKTLDLMRDWVLDELAVSYLESGGFWTHEALLVVKEKLDGELRLVVVEGNRRLAALKYLYAAFQGEDVPIKWKSLIKNVEFPRTLFDQIPYIMVDSRQEIEAFLGFRHVTGIKEWDAEEKAQYIARLIDGGMTYQQVMRKIGSNTPAVRRNYISYRLLLQMGDSLEDFSPEDARGRFSVMFLSLRTQGVQKYLHIDISADPPDAQRPVPKEHLDALANFARWLFGSKQHNRDPLFTDSRRVADFGWILENHRIVEYLEQEENPSFEHAFQLAGGNKSEIIQLLNKAASNVQIALGQVHHYEDLEDIQQAVKRLGVDVRQLLKVFPNIYQELQEREEKN